MKLFSTILFAALACAGTTLALSPEEAPTIDKYLSDNNITTEHMGAQEVGDHWARIHNKCPYDVYLWSVDKMNDPQVPLHMSPGAWHHERYRQPCDQCGVAIKISRDNHLRGGVGGNHMHFEYAINQTQIYWDISFVDCAYNVSPQGGNADNCPGHERGIRINTSVQGDGCVGVHCLPNSFCPDDAYYIPDPDVDWHRQAPVKGCPKGVLTSDAYMTLCYDG